MAKLCVGLWLKHVEHPKLTTIQLMFNTANVQVPSVVSTLNALQDVCFYDCQQLAVVLTGALPLSVALL